MGDEALLRRLGPPGRGGGDCKQAKERFESGASLIAFDGVGGWHESLSRVRRQPRLRPWPMGLLRGRRRRADVFKGNPANIFSFIKKTDPAKIEELLGFANFFASPFGTQENVLLNYGVEGVHHQGRRRVPEENDIGNKEVTITYTFLASPAGGQRQGRVPRVRQGLLRVDGASGAQGPGGPLLRRPDHGAGQVGSLSKPFEDLEKDVMRGRKAWRTSTPRSPPGRARAATNSATSTPDSWPRDGREHDTGTESRASAGGQPDAGTSPGRTAPAPGRDGGLPARAGHTGTAGLRRAPA